MNRTTGRLAAVLLAVSLVAVACGGNDATTTTQAQATTTTGPMAGDTTTTDGMTPTGAYGLPIIDPLSVTAGDIGIAGSSTVFPLSLAVVSRWEDEGGPQYAIESIGSGGGLERFCVDGASDIANASREIKDSEVAACASIGREIISIRVGTDALSVVISNGNYFAQSLTLEEVALAFSLPDGSTWDMVNPAFPAHPMERYSPGTDSGTFDYFHEVVYPDVDLDTDPSPILQADVEIVGEDDELTVAGVKGDGCTEGNLGSTCAIGYFGYAYFQQNAGDLQVTAIDGVVPSDESVNAATYAIARPLYMYTSRDVVASKPQVAQFIAYFLQVVNDVIGTVGYFPAPEASLQEAADNIKEAAGF